MLKKGYRIEDRFELRKEIGSGASGQVWEAIDR